MITVTEAREIILENAKAGPAEQVTLTDALGRTLRETVIAARAQPPFTASAMDGYAVRSANTPGLLHVVGEAGAGRALARALGPGECARIFTGAPLPPGTDAVVIQEEVELNADTITAPHADAGRHVRRAGADFAACAALLETGRSLDAPAIALAAAAGRARLRVARRPRIAILSGGDEVVAPGADPAPDQIFDSVGYGVAALVHAWGGEARLATPFPDDPNIIAARVSLALSHADVVVVIGGASVGDRDHARSAVRGIGAELLFEKVALRPGKPTWLARRDGGLVLGLPGNPASAFVCARLFLRPLIERLLGRDVANAVRTRRARLVGALAANGPRETYLRARLHSDDQAQVWARCSDRQDSSFLSVLAAANALVVRAPNAATAQAGELVDTLDL
jgi:molybdopterin molybdotransferase